MTRKAITSLSLFDDASRVSDCDDESRHDFVWSMCRNIRMDPITLLMGHVRTDILFNHYRELVSQQEANDFWEIRPAEKAAVLRFLATA